MNYPCGKANYAVHLATELAGTLPMVTDQGDKMPLYGKEKKALSTDSTRRITYKVKTLLRRKVIY